MTQWQLGRRFSADNEAFSLQANTQCVCERRLIVYDQHIVTDRNLGILSVNTEPSPSFDSTRTSPMVLITCRTILSPSPVPPVARLRFIDTIETLENAIELSSRHSNSIVGHLDVNFVVKFLLLSQQTLPEHLMALSTKFPTALEICPAFIIR